VYPASLGAFVSVLPASIYEMDAAHADSSVMAQQSSVHALRDSGPKSSNYGGRCGWVPATGRCLVNAADFEEEEY